MKKLFLSISLILGIFLLLPSKTFAAGYQDYVRSFHSDVTLNKDASISIKETIKYHFASEKHGIYREIPVNYKVSGSFMRPTILKINELYYYPDDFPSVKNIQYERSLSNGYAVLKIGDPDYTIMGDYTYVIDYKLVYAVNYFNDHDELYLNITGNGWEVPIDEATATVSLPGSITDKVCYTGLIESKESNCTITQTDNNLSVKAENLGQYEGLTLVVAMPKNTIANTTSQQRVLSVIANIGIILPIPTLICLILLLKKYNKNKKLTIIPNYDVPKGWNPLRSGFLYKKTLTNTTISAQIIALATGGYIKIKQLSNRDYELIKTSKEAPIDPEEKILYEGLFKNVDTIRLKKLGDKFFNTVQTLKASTERHLYEDKYLLDTKKKAFNIMMVVSLIGIAIPFFSAKIFLDNAAMSWFLGILISFVLVLIFAFRIDKKSPEGNEIYYELEGLKMYINTAEKHRIEFHDDPKKYLGVFEKLLPYAMIFGLEKKWAKEFEDIYLEQPDWYEGNTNMFNSYFLVNSLNHMNQQVVSNMVASNSAHGFASSRGGSGGSGFGGGGFSGGGFGGGGGGSW